MISLIELQKVLIQGSIFLNTSLTESFGIAIVEAACAGLYVVSTRVGGVPEVLPEDMISFAKPDEDGKPEQNESSLLPLYINCASDVIRAMSEAIRIVSQGKHNPIRAHERITQFYNWSRVAKRTEDVYNSILQTEPRDLWTRMQRSVTVR